MAKVLIDTSVWIEFFRKREPYHKVATDLIDNDEVCCIGVIYAELLQGAKSKIEIDTIKEFTHVFDFLSESISHWEKAGELSYELLRKGKTIGLADCYISVLAKSVDAELFTLDNHFQIIKKDIGLKLYKV